MTDVDTNPRENSVSETTTTTPVASASPPLISTSPANQATAAASNTAAMAFVVIIVWLIGLVHITVPAEVATAFTVLFGAVVHFAVIKWGLASTP